ncbi:MAG: hypothetical protein Ct9H300mP23_04430 [Nitrospinota bacterium]|nr:MAG: hypothetical protein Ct9H300mP23_04430 [Nitrospinota bacterium]
MFMYLAKTRGTYEKVKPAMVKNILNDHIVGGKPFKKAASKEDYYTTLEKQTRVALAHGARSTPKILMTIFKSVAMNL